MLRHLCYTAFYNYSNKWVVEKCSASVSGRLFFAARTSITAAVHLHDRPVTIYHELALDVTQSFCIVRCQFISPSLPCMHTCAGALLCPTRQRASMKCPDWRLTQSIRSTSCLVESVPRGLKMESSRATPCHLDRVDLGAGLSARTAECIKRCTTTFKYCLSFWESYFFFFFLKRLIFTQFRVALFHIAFSLYVPLWEVGMDYLYPLDLSPSADFDIHCLLSD